MHVHGLSWSMSTWKVESYGVSLKVNTLCHSATPLPKQKKKQNKKQRHTFLCCKGYSIERKYSFTLNPRGFEQRKGQ